MPHVTLEFAHEVLLQQAATDRRLRILLGAGASQEAGLPRLSTLSDQVAEYVTEEFPDTRLLFERGNVERVLSAIRKAVSILEGEDRLAGLDASALSAAEKTITSHIVEAIEAVKDPGEGYRRFARWLSERECSHASEVFTLNYDWLLERALDECSAAYFDGFVGTEVARFRPDLVDATGSTALPSSVLRIWKLHGSIFWRQSPTGEIVRTFSNADTDRAAIYPSDEKYSESRRRPFLTLQDRLRRALSEPDSVLLILGYSFADAHINEIIFSAARDYPRLSVIVMGHKTVAGDLKKVAEAYHNVSVTCADRAILAGQEAPWSADGSGGLYADGGFTLSTFGAVAEYLADSLTTRLTAGKRPA